MTVTTEADVTQLNVINVKQNVIDVHVLSVAQAGGMHYDKSAINTIAFYKINVI